jgi:hypothetical protein
VKISGLAVYLPQAEEQELQNQLEAIAGPRTLKTCLATHVLTEYKRKALQQNNTYSFGRSLRLWGLQVHHPAQEDKQFRIFDEDFSLLTCNLKVSEF